MAGRRRHFRRYFRGGLMRFVQSNDRHSVRLHLTAGASMIALLASMPLETAIAADAAAQQAQAPAVEEIVVTGSRIVRDGYEAPTPVTVVGAEQLQDASKVN